jgi:hypothetical protein
MAIGLFASNKNTRGLKGNSNAKSAITPHQRITLMVRQTRKRNNREPGQARQAIYKQFQVNLQKASMN